MMRFETDRVVGVLRRVEGRVANPLVAAVLRSPFHWLLSRWLLLLSYEGRMSGKRYTTPVLYRRARGKLVLFTPAGETNWWKNFREDHPLSVLLRGVEYDCVGRVDNDEGAVVTHLRYLIAPVDRPVRVLFGRSFPSDAALRRHADAFVLVRVSLDDSRPSTVSSPNPPGEHEHQQRHQ